MEHVLYRKNDPKDFTRAHNLHDVQTERERERREEKKIRDKGKRKAKALVGSESDPHDAFLSHFCTHQVCKGGLVHRATKISTVDVSGPCSAFFQSPQSPLNSSMSLWPSRCNRRFCHAFRHRHRREQQPTNTASDTSWGWGKLEPKRKNQQRRILQMWHSKSSPYSKAGSHQPLGIL